MKSDVFIVKSFIIVKGYVARVYFLKCLAMHMNVFHYKTFFYFFKVLKTEVMKSSAIETK